MLTREEIEQREIESLAPYAVKSRFSQGRAFEEKMHPYRSVFQRDKDRILFCAAFRRLQYKTQVFSNFEGDYYRTRLTHTLEVSNISRSIARSLRLNEDLSEAIALAHDLGHGPFGHIGEQILDQCMKDKGGFEHNRQSYRVVESLEDIYTHGKGLNLTYETKCGLLKHQYDSSATDLPVSYSMLEAQIVDAADEIAYSCHDIDDGLCSRLFSEDDLSHNSLWNRLRAKVSEEHPGITHYQYVRLIIRYLVNALVTDLLRESERRLQEFEISTFEDIKKCTVPLIDFSAEMKKERQELSAFLFDNFYRNERVINILDFARECLTGLFKAFLNDPAKMPRHFNEKITIHNEDPHRIICDYIAGMTDRYAYNQYELICH